MKKRIAGALLCLIMGATTLLGCGGGVRTEEVRIGDVNGDGKILVGYISKSKDDPLHISANAYAEETLDTMVADGMIDEWTGILDGQADPYQQIDLATNCIAKAYDYVIILPADEVMSDTTVRQMAYAGIKVIVANTRIECAGNREIVTGYIDSDEYEAGKMLANWIVRNCPEGGVYTHCLSDLGSNTQNMREEGIKDVMREYPEFESAGDFECEGQGEMAAEVTANMIRRHEEELVAMICDNDEMAVAAQEKCMDKDRSDIICIGADGTPAALQMVKDGQMKATVLQDVKSEVAAAIEMVKSHLNGETPERKVVIPYVLVTSENVDQYLQ